MAMSVYVHIPYCLQRCRYCDFTTFEQSEIMVPERYVEWVKNEIRNRHHFWNDQELKTLYFGGGTPSLLPSSLIVTICQELANVGFKLTQDHEITIEINPATLTEEKLNVYLEAGINRFSVGAQTFDDSLLKMCGRRHNAADTRETLNLLIKYKLNYSFDLLFALSGQTLEGLKLDLEEVANFAPPHLSAYCLTVPEGHPMSYGRPIEDEQIEMFNLIENAVAQQGLKKYEISNFAKPGLESRHNIAYWSDQNYWGIGLSSHSYDRAGGDFGLRFWNPKSLKEYGRQAEAAGKNFQGLLPEVQYEQLQQHEALTDYCHMHLRTAQGLSREGLSQKFKKSVPLVVGRLKDLVTDKLLAHGTLGWSLTREGQLLSNEVFRHLTFSPEELSN